MLQEIELPFGNINHNDHLKMVELIRKINSHYHKEIMFLGGKFMANFVDPVSKKRPQSEIFCFNNLTIACSKPQNML